MRIMEDVIYGKEIYSYLKEEKKEGRREREGGVLVLEAVILPETSVYSSYKFVVCENRVWFEFILLGCFVYAIPLLYTLYISLYLSLILFNKYTRLGTLLYSENSHISKEPYGTNIRNVKCCDSTKATKTLN